MDCIIKEDDYRRDIEPIFIHQRYLYGTKLGIENKRPELLQDKNCNILFEFNVHKIRDISTRQAFLNKNIFNKRNDPIIMDIGLVDSILMSLNEASLYPINGQVDSLVSLKKLCGKQSKTKYDMTFLKKYKQNQYDTIKTF